jgi:hypothetical protein
MRKIEYKNEDAFCEEKVAYYKAELKPTVNNNVYQNHLIFVVY